MSMKQSKTGYRYLSYGLLTALLLVTSSLFVFAQDTAACEAGSRLFTHALGESCIPEHPLRVVVLDTGELDNALALGAPVVGAPVEDALRYQAYLDGQLEGIASTGSISEPNFEAILALAPDLILGSKQRYEAIYPQLSEIAPTVLTQSLRVPWQENFNLHADALGRTTEAETLLAAYDAQVADVQAALGDSLNTLTVSIIRFRPGQVRLYLKSSYIGYILQDVGLQRPPSQDQDVFSAEISIEEMQQADADYIFVTGYDVEDSERETFLNSPMWQTLGAVQSGRVIDVNDDTWIAGLGVQAAQLVLADLVRYLGAPTTTATTCEPGFRLFDHELLATDPVCVPEDPQRIVALDMSIIELLMIAGETPAAVPAVAFNSYIRMHPELESPLNQVLETAVDTGYPPNLEAILSSEPDLIISPNDFISQTIFEELNASSTTILFTPQPGDWRNRLSFAGELLGLTETVDQVLADYDVRVAELKDALASDAAETTVSLIRTFPDQIGLLVSGTNAAAILESVGLARPESQSVDYDYVLSQLNGRPEILISTEELGLADGDYIFVFGDTSALVANPLWGALGAVQNGQAFEVGYYWWGDDLFSAHDILDDLFTHIAGIEAENGNPFENGLE